MLSAYELQRKETIAQNTAHLASLGIEPLIKKGRTVGKRNVIGKREPVKPRESARARKLPIPVCMPGQEDKVDESSLSDKIAQGARVQDGRWRGEVFGEVEGVEVGKCFGAGDYQRLGRQEMSDTGFFRPFVTPEWNHPNDGCFSLILNNDNGQSHDEGDTVLYAGSGGRRRGQNRTAPQTFDQDWTNITNAALRRNHETGRPIRLIRGPKLLGAWGTAATGGGYRYDGLYRVAEAALVRTGMGGRLMTAMFTLHKL